VRFLLCCLLPVVAPRVRGTYVHDKETQEAKRVAQDICTKRWPRRASCPGCVLHDVCSGAVRLQTRRTTPIRKRRAAEVLCLNAGANT
jgi:hypothetical protein